jgi:hypothetical protein
MGWLHANGKPVIIAPFSHIKSCTVAYLDNKLNFFHLHRGTESRGDGRHAILQLVGDHPQQVPQQSGNCGNDLFAATYDDKIQVVIQMINYMAYFKGKSFGTGLSRQELKLKVAGHSGNPKEDC